jgi:hypothetical protein
MNDQTYLKKSTVITIKTQEFFLMKSIMINRYGVEM